MLAVLEVLEENRAIVRAETPLPTQRQKKKRSFRVAPVISFMAMVGFVGGFWIGPVRVSIDSLIEYKIEVDRFLCDLLQPQNSPPSDCTCDSSAEACACGYPQSLTAALLHLSRRPCDCPPPCTCIGYQNAMGQTPYRMLSEPIR
jgi:hypothetical protein